MKNTSKLRGRDKPLSDFSWAFLFVWVAGAFLFLTTSTIVLQICGLVVAIGGAFGAIWFYAKSDKAYDVFIVAMMLLLCSFFTEGKESQGYVVGFGSFVIGATAAIFLSKVSKSS